jgi:hypothetical protein
MIEGLAIGVLTLVIIALIVGHTLYVKETNAEKSKLINALISKNATELRDLDLSEKVEPIRPLVATPPDLIPESELSDEEFSKHILEEGK